MVIEMQMSKRKAGPWTDLRLLMVVGRIGRAWTWPMRRDVGRFKTRQGTYDRRQQPRYANGGMLAPLTFRAP